MSESLILLGLAAATGFLWSGGTQIPGFPKYPKGLKRLQDDESYIFECDDPVYESLKKKIEDPDDVFDFVKDNFSIELMAKQIADLYYDLKNDLNQTNNK